MTDSFRDWADQHVEHEPEGPLPMTRGEYWLRAFVKEVKGEFGKSNCSCGVCYHDAYLKKVLEFGLDEQEKS